MTPEHAYEEADLRPYLDPFDEEDARRSAAQGPQKLNSLEWTFHSAQSKAWVSKARTKVLVSGRRWGKSELLVRWALAGARDDQLRGIRGITWIILPTYDMARPIWRKYMALAPPGWITNTIGTDARPDYIALGDARIEFKSGEHPERLVGEGLRRVVIDEAGLIKERVYKESILPALMDHGAPSFLAGTPKGRNWFYHLYNRGLDPLDTEVETFGGPSAQNPFLKSGEIERLRKELPERLFEQEVLARFLADEGAVFRAVRDCLTLNGEFSTNPTVAIGVDLARKTDFTVLVGLDRQRNMTFFDRFQKISWPLQKQRIQAAYNKYGKPAMLIDSTGVGDPIVQDLYKAGMVRVKGFQFTHNSKADLVDGLTIAVEGKQVGLAEVPVLLNEMEAFGFTTTRTGLVRYSSPESGHDDAVMALALAYKACKNAGNSGITL